MVVTRVVRLTYPRELLKQPILNRLIREFDLLTNIMQADVSAQAGCLILEIRGQEAVVGEALEWLATRGLNVHVLSKDEEMACNL
jgi:L-aspartate semialdehyde sulfurtransferase ferredoxin